MTHNIEDYPRAYKEFKWQIPATFNFGTDVVDHWALTADGPALIWCNAAGEERRYNFSDIARLSGKLADGLQRRGVQKGDRVVIMLPRIPEWQIAMVACMKLGAVPIPCIEMLTPKDLAYRIDNAGARAVIARAEHAAKFTGMYERLPVRISVGKVPGWDLIDALIEGGSEDFKPAAVAAEDPALLYYTSGSTGNPKGVLHASRAIYAWREVARSWLDLRPGDSTADRLQRARALARLTPDDPEAALTVARAAIDATDYALARKVLDPLVSASAERRPSIRTCLLMADLEEADGGNAGLLREWLARASRAPRDKAWVADGVVSDTWAPVSPVTGKLDAYRWQVPPERLTAAPFEPLPEQPVAVEEPKPLTIEAPPALPEPAAAPVPEPVPAAEVATAPAPETGPDASTRLAAIRAAAKDQATPPVAPRKPEIFPLVSAPDDPGPDPRG